MNDDERLQLKTTISHWRTKCAILEADSESRERAAFEAGRSGHLAFEAMTGQERVSANWQYKDFDDYKARNEN